MRFILPTILLAVSIGLFFLFINPVFEEVKALRVQQESFNEALSNSKKLQEVRGELTKRYNAFSPQDLDKLNKFLTTSPDNIRLIINIETIALQYGMVPTNIKFDIEQDVTPAEFTREEARERNFNVFNLEFSTAGTYDKFINFIKDLEKNLRLIDITSLSFSSAASRSPFAGEQTDIYTYDFKIRTYWVK